VVCNWRNPPMPDLVGGGDALIRKPTKGRKSARLDHLRRRRFT
jgi:hypothetical protein